MPWLIRFARGSIGRARLAAEYRLDEWARVLAPMIDGIASAKADPQLGPTILRLVDEFAESWVKNHKGASKDAANKAAVRHMLGLIGEFCRERLREVAEKADPADPAAAEEAAQPWLAGIDLIQEAQWNLESNVALALLLDNLAIQWAASSKVLTV